MSDEPPQQPSGGPFGRHFSAREEGSPYPKAALLPRLLARLTDFMLAFIPVLALGDLGRILALLFILFADGMFLGQSPGKRLLGIKVVHVPSRCDVSYRESALRNFPFAFAFLFDFIPEYGRVAFAFFFVSVVLFEGYQVLTEKLGLRMGDLFAETQVVDTKVPAGAAVRPVLKVVSRDAAQSPRLSDEP